jgi:two-component system chemotaxis response regulator CheY
VDDEAHIRKFVGLVLKKICTPTVFEAADGLAALERYEQEQPDLVLLDVNMPHLDGIQTLERLRVIAPDAKVVMLTSLANRQTVEQCAHLGALDYIRKDTSRDQLTAQLEQILVDCFEPETESQPPSDPLVP